MFKISIIICTHRRFQLLDLAISSLCNQTANKEDFEVIVVDNDISANNRVKEIVGKATNFIHCVYIHEPLIGLSQARNTGGKAAKAEYIGYMDDDAKAPSKYISTANRIIKEIHPDIFGGPYNAFYLSKPPKWYKNEYGSNSNNNFHGFFSSNQFVDGMNMVFNKSILEKNGWFEDKLGMKGNKIWYGEETMVQMRAWKENLNLKVWYDKNLFVEHLVPSNKMRLSDKFRRSYNLGKSQAYFWLKDEKKNRIKQKAILKISKTIAFLLLKGISAMFILDRKKYKYWQNYVYEEFSRYFASIGQELQYIKDRRKFQ